MLNKYEIPIKLFLTTWNTGFSEPPASFSDHWLKDIQKYDVVVISLQEFKSNLWIHVLEQFFIE